MRALGILVALAALAAPSVGAGSEGDRLAQYRETGLHHGQASAEEADRLAEALFELVDAEILENLASGPPFASAAFIQDRLEALGGAWGGMSLRLVRPAAGSTVMTVVLGLAGAQPAGSLRFYATGPTRPRRLAAATHPGRPQTYPWPSAGAVRLAASWVGAEAPGGSHALWLEVWELGASEHARPVWQSATVFPEGLSATGFAVGGGRMSLRYPARYAGFKPACPGQTQIDEVYRAGPGGRVVLERRSVTNGWHRALAETADRLFQALESGDRRALAAIAPDARVRDRLPARLRHEGACEQRLDGGRAVVVAATETRGAVLRAWSLRFADTGRGWRLTAASPVLE